ncbi:TlpA family protein disulfide reductase [Sphingobacterium suaedae]|uniref:TlpA family protein disulfide reductase n=1 Tax=Sphingobacterium suaedae TaxID=1686402 RepID=A0ABW5KKP5_9SPHI
MEWKKISCTVLFMVACVFAQAQEWKVPLKGVVPDFSVETKTGDKIEIKSLRGKVVLLNFFATWCPPCRQELPRLQREIWEKWGKREDFAVCVLAREEGWDKLDPFIKSTGYTFPIYPDLKRGVFGLFAESQIPRNILIDRDGKVIYQSIGYEEAEFTQLIHIIKAELDK